MLFILFIFKSKLTHYIFVIPNKLSHGFILNTEVLERWMPGTLSFPGQISGFVPQCGPLYLTEGPPLQKPEMRAARKKPLWF